MPVSVYPNTSATSVRARHQQRAPIGAVCRYLAPALLALLTLCAARAATAAEMPTHEGPRIGLALSGGGARGAAHIGVLKVLEDLRIPVHCIAGTSMGSIVGGAYASGLTPKQMEELIVGTNWSEVFTDRPPRAEISIRRKADDYKNLYAPEFGVSEGVTVPKGLIAGVSVESFLREVTQSAAQITDFSLLPIPFRAVAADIATGEEVVMSEGSLAEALRASMSLPGVVPPVERDGRLLVDGGIANNLPIDVVRNLCADIVIAVDIGTPPMKREEIGSALTVVGQLINLLGQYTVNEQKRSLKQGDILISPELGDIASTSFERQAEAVRIGEAAARAAADELRRYSIPEARYAELRRTQQPTEYQLGVVDEIRFEGLERTNAAVLRGLVQSQPGQPLTEDEIAGDLRRIYGRGDFEGVNYRIVEDDGRRALVFLPHEKSWGPDYLRFGVALASDFDSEHYFNALINYKKTWLNRLGAEWSTDLQIGRDRSLLTELYQPLNEANDLFVSGYGYLARSVRGVFVDDDRVAEYDTREQRLGLDLGLNFSTWGTARTGLMWRDVRADVDTGAPTLPEGDMRASGFHVAFVTDQLDAPYLSRSGYYLEARGLFPRSGLGADRSYDRMLLRATGVKSFGAHTFNLATFYGTDFHSDMEPFDAFVLGGPLRLSAYPIDRFAGREYAFGRLMYYNQAIKLPSPLGTGLYLGASLEAAEVKRQFTESGSSGGLWSASVFLAADTFLGPIYFGYGRGKGGEDSVFFFIGVP